VKKSSAKISTLVAVSGGLAALPAGALELGDVQVNSSLGQPLRASIAYALAPNEELVSSCVSLQAGLPQNGMPAITSARLSVTDGVIAITGSSPIRDPLVSMRINVRCPYTANLSREYMLFIDPAPVSQPAVAKQATAGSEVQPQSAAASTESVVIRSGGSNAVPAARSQRLAPASIAAGTRHRVQPGESLSEIAQAIPGRPVGLWEAVAAIFDANPDAFIDDDPNKLKAGSWLLIPDFGAIATPGVAAENVFDAGDDSIAQDDAASLTTDTSVATAYEPEFVPAATVADNGDSLANEPLVADPAGNSANPYITADDFIEPTQVGIPDTALESPRASSTAPNVAAANVRPAEAPVRSSNRSSNWLVWLVGGGVALFGALLLFGRLLRERYASSPIGAVAMPERRRERTDVRRIEEASAIEVEFEELRSAQENTVLDADLIIGTGLKQNSDIAVAQDFGYGVPAALDLELPEEMSSGVDSSAATDIIPPINLEMDSILESEVLPDVDDDYDMSVIVDATQVPRPEDVTQKDLEAVPLHTSDERLISDDYTLSHEVDYKVLEQDYEDEFTATQALNNEITRAAAELAARMDEEFGSTEDTAEISRASVTALDITAQLPANNDDISDLDDTGINESITVDMHADEVTVEMPARKGRSA